jgi:hypothetical protein
MACISSTPPRSVSHRPRHGAVLDLDPVDPCRSAREYAGHRTRQPRQQVVGVDGMHQQHPAALGVPAPAPRRLVVIRGPFPRRLDRREVGFAGDPEIDDALGFLHAVAKAVLKDRHHPPGGSFLGHDYPVNLGERADQRLLADDFLAGRECRQDLLEVKRCRRADVDNVDVVHAQQLVEGPSAPRNGEFVGDGREPACVDVADRLHPKLVGMFAVSPGDVVAADPAADHADPPDPGLGHAGSGEMPGADDNFPHGIPSLPTACSAP